MITKNTRTRLISVAVVTFVLYGALGNLGWAMKEEAKTVRIVTSFYPAYIMALNVAGDIDGVSVENMASSGAGCLHDYALTASDMKKISRAHIFVVNGAGMESFLADVVSRNKSLSIINLSEGISTLEENGSINPHVWVSIAGAIAQVQNLGRCLEGLDPSHAGEYHRHTDAYVTKLQALKDSMAGALAPYKGEPIVTFHEAFDYFARDFGFHIVSVIEREPGTQPSARELAHTIDIIKRDKVHMIFSEPQYPASAAHLVANETGAHVYVLDPAVSGAAEKNAYIAIMEHNCAILKNALQEAKENKE